MLNNIKLDNILFIDIETVPQYKSHDEQPEMVRLLWEKKSSYFRKENESARDVYQRAGIYAEFGKIVCISVGIFNLYQNHRELRIKSFYGDNENKLLSEFINMVNNYSQKKEIELCAHNGKEFDYPYITRRILINNLQLPKLFDIAGKKPWETKMIDTMELWRFGDYKHYTSLELLTTIFNISSPKVEIEGSMIADIYWREKNINKIVEYCQSDVIAIAQLLLRYKGEDLIEEENIKIINS